MIEATVLCSWGPGSFKSNMARGDKALGSALVLGSF